MNTRQLEYVIAVAEERSFSKAADKLHISQPSLSQYIRNIEKSLEVNLFDRSVTPLSLTEIGEEYVKTAYRIIALENNLLKCISDQREKRKTTLNIGISAALNTWEISLALAEVRTKYPDTIITAHELFSINMDDLLEQGINAETCEAMNERMRETYRKMIREIQASGKNLYSPA